MAAIQEVADRTKVPTTIYVDTDVGADDETATGAESAPYKSLAFAYIKHGGTDSGKTYLSRASKTGTVAADADPAEKLVYKEPAKSAVKKAQSALDQHKKKYVTAPLSPIPVSHPNRNHLSSHVLALPLLFPNSAYPTLTTLQTAKSVY